jgi:hypothetical protein
MHQLRVVLCVIPCVTACTALHLKLGRALRWHVQVPSLSFTATSYNYSQPCISLSHASAPSCSSFSSSLWFCWSCVVPELCYGGYLVCQGPCKITDAMGRNWLDVGPGWGGGEKWLPCCFCEMLPTHYLQCEQQCSVHMLIFAKTYGASDWVVMVTRCLQGCLGQGLPVHIVHKKGRMPKPAFFALLFGLKYAAPHCTVDCSVSRPPHKRL